MKQLNSQFLIFAAALVALLAIYAIVDSGGVGSIQHRLFL